MPQRVLLSKNHMHWPSVDFDKADLLLPDAPGVYIVMGKGSRTRKTKRPLYVGRSENLHLRWARGHHKALACLRLGAEVVKYQITDDFIDFERVMISHMCPPLNEY